MWTVWIKSDVRQQPKEKKNINGRTRSSLQAFFYVSFISVIISDSNSVKQKYTFSNYDPDIKM